MGWDLGEAIHKTADSSVYQKILDILRDQRFKKARQMLPYALVKIKDHRKETIQVLLEILGDPDVTPHTIDALAKLKAVETIPVLQAYLDSSVPLVKRQAAKALKKLEKAAGKVDPIPTPQPTEVIFEVEPVESSANFDAEQVGPFLGLLAAKLEGFGQPDIDQIESRLLEMEVDEEEILSFQVRYDGKETPLQIAIFLDDVDAPDVAFFTSPELAEVIDKLMEKELM